MEVGNGKLFSAKKIFAFNESAGNESLINLIANLKLSHLNVPLNFFLVKN